MEVFVCGDSYEEIMSCIYDAWCMALKVGHENISIVRKKNVRPNLLDEFTYTIADREKTEKVTRSVRSKISETALMWVFNATQSINPDAPDVIYRFMILGFKAGFMVTEMLTEEPVIRLMEINRKVSNEGHHYIEFARFNQVGNVYISHLEPDNNVVFSVAEHFADRMPSEHFMIIDDNRKIAAVHPKDEEVYIRTLSDSEFARLSASETYEDEYTSMWRSFFDAIAIKQRINPTCQNTLFPKKKRKHATEFI